jgi:hypothetical protein
MQSAVTIVAPLRKGIDAEQVRSRLEKLGDALRRSLELRRDRTSAASPALDSLDPAQGEDPDFERIRDLLGLEGLHFLSFFVIPAAGKDPACVGLELSCDGSARAFRRQLASQAQPLRALFEECLPDSGAREWDAGRWGRFLAAHDLGAAGFYVGSPGRSVEQIHDERALRARARIELARVRAERSLGIAPGSGQDLWQRLVPRLQPSTSRPPRRPFWVRWGLNREGLPARLATAARSLAPALGVAAGLGGLRVLAQAHQLAWLVLPGAGVLSGLALIGREWPASLTARGVLRVLAPSAGLWLRASGTIVLGFGCAALAVKLLGGMLSVPLAIPVSAVLAGIGGVGALLAGVLAYLLLGSALLGASLGIVWVAAAVLLFRAPGALALALGAVWLLALVPVAVLAVAIRSRELEDSEGEISVDPAHLQRVQQREDLFAQNHLAVVSTLREGPRPWLPRLVLPAVLRLVTLTSRVVFNRGVAGGVRSLHFTRFVLLPGSRRMLFLSNYDGPFGAYLQDFTAAQFVTAAWSNTVAFPRSLFLFGAGAEDEQRFKAVARQSQIQTLGWWSAYPDLTVSDIDAASELRENLFRPVRVGEPTPAPRWFWKPISEADCDRAWRQI